MRRSTAVVCAVALTLGCSARRAFVVSAPQSRDITITTVPLLSHELETIYPFLKPDFGPGGVLEGKEVYAFSPSTIVVMVGDTLHLSFVNPEDDQHSFVLPDLYVALSPMSRHDTTYVARRHGIFVFSCSVPSHVPMMRGELVVLSPERMAGGP